MSDEGVGKRMLSGLLSPIFSSAKNKANLESIAKLCEEKLSKITELEKARCASVDEPAKLFGELLGGIFAEGIEGGDGKAMYSLGYHLGRFILAADAAEDYEKDRKSGSYNPYVEAYGGAEITPENKATIKCALMLECRGIELALNLLPFGKRVIIENIMRNVIYLGLPKRIEFLDSPNLNNCDKKENEE